MKSVISIILGTALLWKYELLLDAYQVAASFPSSPVFHRIFINVLLLYCSSHSRMRGVTSGMGLVCEYASRALDQSAHNGASFVLVLTGLVMGSSCLPQTEILLLKVASLETDSWYYL